MTFFAEGSRAKDIVVVVVSDVAGISPNGAQKRLS